MFLYFLLFLLTSMCCHRKLWICGEGSRSADFNYNLKYFSQEIYIYIFFLYFLFMHSPFLYILICLFLYICSEGPGEDWFYQPSYPLKIKNILSYLILYFISSGRLSESADSIPIEWGERELTSFIQSRYPV